MSVAAPSGGTSPVRDYLEAVLDLLEEHALNRERVDWARVRREAEAQIADATATVTGQAYGGAEVERRYIREGAAVVRDLDRHRPKGWVVDLRGNAGGSMYPMLTVLAPLLGHGHLGSFVDAAGEVSGRWLLRGGVVYVDDEALSAIPHPYLPAEPEPPVAVLIDGRTMSAGETTLSQWPARPIGPAASTATLPSPRTSPRRGMPTRSPTPWRGYGPFGPRPQGGVG
ncbi:S41 family peptidase [Streptomyces nigrescens]